MNIKYIQLKKALRSVLLVLLLSVVGMGKMSAQEFTVGELRYTINDDGVSVTVNGFAQSASASGSLIIPETVTYGEANYSVTAIGRWAFNGRSSLTSIEIPNSVISIGLIDGYEQNPFNECNGLEQIIVDSGNPVYDSRNNCNAIIKTNTNALITGCKNTIIPNTVTIIDQWAFGSCDGLTEITIPNSVSFIVGAAFYGCAGLTSIEIPNSVVFIGEIAFYGCTGLTSIEIPNSVVSIGANPFAGCSSLEQIIVDSGNAVFDSRENCNAIITTSTNVLVSGCMNTVIPSSVPSIGSHAFDNCIGLTGSLTIPNFVTTIGDYAFCNCSGLTGSLTIPNSVTTIDSSAFRNCRGFTGSLTIPNSVTTIGSHAFEGCSGFTSSLTIGNSVTTIGEYAFSSCYGFTGSLTIGNSVTTIGSNAFEGCSGFTGGLIIPSSVTTIGNSAFGYCQGFSFVTSLAETPPSLGNNVFQFFNTSKPVCVPCGYEEEYSSLLWGGFTDFIGYCGGSVTVMADPEEGGTVTGGGQIEANQLCAVTAIANEGYVFANWTYNGPVVSFEAEYTFYVADDMTLVAHFFQDGNITFADANVKAICVANWDTNGDGELSYAEAAAVTDLGQVFSENIEITSFEELQFFTGLARISSYAFYNCSNLSGSLNIPNSVTTIGEWAFAYCSGFTGDLAIPNSVTMIGLAAFEGCSGFTGSLTIPNSVTEIDNQSFSGCRGFTGSLTIPNSVTTIGWYAFSGCRGFTGSLTIPNSVITIEYEAFAFCSGFTGSLTIGNSVTTIGNYAFYGCRGFSSMTVLAETPPALGSSVFSSWNSDVSICVPCGFEDAYSSISWGGVAISVGCVEAQSPWLPTQKKAVW